MKNLFATLVMCMIFTSCSQNSVEHDNYKNEFMAYTQKFESVKEGDRYLAVATYLNPVLAEIRNEKEDEIFILTSYPKEISIIPNSVKMNGNDVEIYELNSDDLLLKNEAFNIPWSKKFKIIAPKSDKDNLVITYQTSNGLKSTFKFRKISKSMYWAPKIKIKD